MKMQNNRGSINIEYLDSIDSTNSELKRRISQGLSVPQYTVLSADEQTAGRGRSGHDWQSIKKATIATSMVLYPKGISEDAIPLITILAAVAVTRTIEDLYGLNTTIKWPNDILINKKKICGILSERIILQSTSENGKGSAGRGPDGKGSSDNKGSADKGADGKGYDGKGFDDIGLGDKEPSSAVIVGIGINVYKGSFMPELDFMATDISTEYEKIAENKIKEIHRKEIVESLWNSFITIYEQFNRCSNISFILNEYNEKLVNANRHIYVESKSKDSNDRLEAFAIRMDEDGRLVIKTKDGSIKKIDSGEVHIRGIYGYV